MKFDIQLFNDTVETSEVLQTKFTFTDGDTRTVNVPNPRNNLTSADIQSLSEWIVANNVIIGDQAGAPTEGIESAVIVGTSRIRLDLNTVG